MRLLFCSQLGVRAAWFPQRAVRVGMTRHWSGSARSFAQHLRLFGETAESARAILASYVRSMLQVAP